MGFRTSNCIALGVGDAESAASHYAQSLGWRRVKDGNGWIEMDTGALRIFLCADDETTPTFDLEVDDVEAAKNRLLGLGWHISPLSKTEIYMVSPFGTTFALSTAPAT